MQVLGLKLFAELELADPLPLYPTAWAGGHCQRDVAGTILAKIGTSPEFLAEDVRDLFDVFMKPLKEVSTEVAAAAATTANQR